jgi:transposase
MPTHILAADIAKDKFDAALLIESGLYRRRVLANNHQGFQTLAQWLSKQGAGKVHLCLEATGAYSQGLARFMHEAGHDVSLVNPALIKAYGASELLRNKTDKVDADLIARYCRDKKPRLWQPPAEELEELQALERRLGSLKELRQQEINRLKSGVRSTTVLSCLERTIAFLGEQIRSIESAMQELASHHPALKHKRDLLASIKGIGKLTAAVLLAELGDMSNFSDVRQAVAFCGLSPRNRESGKSVHGRAKMCKQGSVRLRKALYMPAIVARQHNPIIKAFCDRLAQRGLCKMAVIGAAMRKLVHLAYGVLRSGCPFDANYQPALT